MLVGSRTDAALELLLRDGGLQHAALTLQLASPFTSYRTPEGLVICFGKWHSHNMYY